jgi:sugar/nucleoside kinase (ribokinase family)
MNLASAKEDLMADSDDASRIDVLGLGVISVDILMQVPRLPAEEDKVFAASAALQGGGLTATALVAVSRLGGRGRILGCLGQSRFAEQALADLHDEGVDVAGILRRPGAEPVVAVVLVDQATGQRTIVASFAGVTYPRPDELPLVDVERAGCILVDSESGTASVALAEAARARGVPVVVDLESVNEHTATLVRLASDVVVGKRFVQDYLHTADIAGALEKLWSQGEHHSIVITRGALGVDWCSREGVFHRDAFPVRAVDTTGCGDVFHGAFALCRARRLPLSEAIRTASAAAALKTRRIGGRAGIPTPQELAEFLTGQPDAPT